MAYTVYKYSRLDGSKNTSYGTTSESSKTVIFYAKDFGFDSSKHQFSTSGNRWVWYDYFTGAVLGTSSTAGENIVIDNLSTNGTKVICQYYTSSTPAVSLNVYNYSSSNIDVGSSFRVGANGGNIKCIYIKGTQVTISGNRYIRSEDYNKIVSSISKSFDLTWASRSSGTLFVYEYSKVSYSATNGGSVTCSCSYGSVSSGNAVRVGTGEVSLTFTATNSSGYSAPTWTVNGETQGTGNSLKWQLGTSDIVVVANYEEPSYTLSVVPYSHCSSVSISGTSDTSVSLKAGESRTISAEPEDSYYAFSKWWLDDSHVWSGEQYQTMPVTMGTSNAKYYAYFVNKKRTIKVSGNSYCTVSPEGSTDLKEGDSLIISAKPNDWCEFDYWSKNGVEDDDIEQTDTVYAGTSNDSYKAYCSPLKFTVTYTAGNCDRVSRDSQQITGGQEWTINSSIYKSNTKSTFNYNINWIDSRAGNTNTNSTDGVNTTSYSDFYFTGSPNGRCYPGESQGWWAEATLTANYGSSDTYQTSSSKVGELPSQAEIPGYKNNGWYTENDIGSTKVRSTDIIESDSTFYSVRTGITYKINFVQSPNSGVTWPDGDKPTYIQKTFGETSYDFPSIVPVRQGYEFVGWGTSSDMNWWNSNYSSEVISYPDHVRQHSDWWNTDIVRPGTTLDEKWDEKYSVNGSNVTLYTIWRPINKYIKLHWFTTDSDNEHTYNYRYTIADNVASVYSPAAYGRTDVMTGDWVFYGYKDYDDEETRAKEWTNCKGIYYNINLIKNVVLPYNYAVSKTPNWELESWDSQGYPSDDDISQNIYGFWTITGKYVNVNGSWKKVTCVYVNTAAGALWMPMNGILPEDYTSFSVAESQNKWHGSLTDDGTVYTLGYDNGLYYTTGSDLTLKITEYTDDAVSVYINSPKVYLSIDNSGNVDYVKSEVTLNRIRANNGFILYKNYETTNDTVSAFEIVIDDFKNVTAKKVSYTKKKKSETTAEMKEHLISKMFDENYFKVSDSVEWKREVH